MTIEEAKKILECRRPGCGRSPIFTEEELCEAYDMAIEALDLISHIKDRPCDVCGHNKGNGCTRWECVFDEHLCRKEK